MRITQEADYALRIVSVLAQAQGAVGAPQVAEAVGVPQRFAAKILRKLLLAGLVKSTRGVAGGFSLAAAAKDITLLQVIEAIDGQIAIRHCLAEGHICSNHKDKGACAFHHVFTELNEMIRTRLGRLSLADMTDKNVPIEALISKIK